MLGIGPCRSARLMWLGRRLTRLGRGELRGGSWPACSPSATGRLGFDEVFADGAQEVTMRLSTVVGGSGDGRSDGGGWPEMEGGTGVDEVVHRGVWRGI